MPFPYERILCMHTQLTEQLLCTVGVHCNSVCAYCGGVGWGGVGGGVGSGVGWGVPNPFLHGVGMSGSGCYIRMDTSMW